VGEAVVAGQFRDRHTILDGYGEDCHQYLVTSSPELSEGIVNRSSSFDNGVRW
jgi:hypothetical protein